MFNTIVVKLIKQILFKYICISKRAFFFQQSINVEGLPFIVTKNSKEALRQQAIAQLMIELKKGEDSVKNEAEWIPEEEVLDRLGEKE